MADTATSSPVVADATHKARPEKPDEEKYKTDLAQAEKEHDATTKKFNDIKAKLDSARPGRDSPANDKFKALVEEQKSIRTQQSTGKGQRQAQHDKFNVNDTKIKSLIAEQKESRTRIGFKSVQEIEEKIRDLRAQVDSGKLKIVDEKKNLAEISSLEKRKKGFAGLDDLQKQIDAKKAENTELKKTFDSAESRALAQKYEDNQKALDEIKAGRDDVNRNFDTLKAEKDKAYNDQNVTYADRKRVKDEYFQAKRAYKEYEDTLYQQRRERLQAERDQSAKEKRRKIAEQKLEEASEPAYGDQIRIAESLMVYFDPSSAPSTEDKGPGEYAATSQRTVEESGFKGTKVVKKDDDDFFVGTGGKKKGKGKKGPANGTAAPSGGKFNMNAGTIEQLSKVGVEPPSTKDEVPGVVEKLKEKLAVWKRDQENQTKKNVEKAQKEIDDLEKQATEPPVSSSQPRTNSRRRDDRGKKEALKNSGMNNGVSAEAEHDQEKDAAADVTKDLKEASIEDKENESLEA